MTHKMNPEVKAKWVAALRSGKYKQGRGRLRSHEGFCCYGVLCDLLHPNLWDRFSHNGREGLPSEEVRMAAGFVFSPILRQHELPRVVIAEDMRELYDLNDSGGMSFSKIADAIEEQL